MITDSPIYIDDDEICVHSYLPIQCVCLRDTLERIHIFLLYLHLYRSLIYMDHGVISVRFRSLAVHIFIRWRLLGLAWIQSFVSCPCTRIEPKCAERVDLFKQRSSSPSLSWWTRTGCEERLGPSDEQSVWRTFLAQHHTDGLYLESGSPNKLPTLQVIQLLMNITCTCSIHPPVHVITTITIIIIFNIRRCVGLEWISAPFSAIFIQNFKLFHIR